MRLIGYEIKKLLCVRYLWVILALLLVLNGVVAYMSAKSHITEGISSREIEDFYRMYVENPDEMEALYEKIQAFNEENNRLLLQAMQSGQSNIELPEWQNRIAPAGHSDAYFFRLLYKDKEDAQAYPRDVDRVIRVARATLRNLEQTAQGQNSFSYQYQSQVIRLYTNLLKRAEFDTAYRYGWAPYFTYDGVHLFLFVLIAVFGSVVFAQEMGNGMHPLVRCSKRGRMQTATAKLIAFALWIIMAVLVFTLTTFWVFGLTLGFSSPNEPLQVLGAFRMCPYAVTIGKYFFISTVLRVLAFLCFGLLFLAVTAVMFDVVTIYATGLCLIGLQFLLSHPSPSRIEHPTLFLNLLTVASAHDLFERYRAFSVLGHSVGYINAIPWLYGILCLLCAGFCIFVFVRGVVLQKRGKRKRRKLEMVKKIHEMAERWHRSQTYGGIWRGEWHKVMIASHIGLLILILLVSKIFLTGEERSDVVLRSDSCYEEYMTRYAGELSEEKEANIREELASFSEIQSQYDLMRERYFGGQISHEVYFAYVSSYLDAQFRSEVLQMVLERVEYLKKTEENTSLRGYLLYDSGWISWFEKGIDFFLLAAILLMNVGLFAVEYEQKNGCFATILRTTVKGRRHIFYVKFVLSALMACVLFVLFDGLDWIRTCIEYTLPLSQAPLVSLPLFENTNSDITIGQYASMINAVRLIATILVSLLTAALSGLLRKKLSAFATAALIILVPCGLVALGWNVASYVDVIQMMRGTPLYLTSSNFMWDMGGLIVTVLAWIILTLVLILQFKNIYVDDSNRMIKVGKRRG